jgi:hypothetical protein
VRTDIQDCVDDARERRRNWKCAEGSWTQIRSTDPHAYSPDYGQGFKEGFAEYLYSGKEDSPALAPAHYRRFSYQTPQGYHAIEDWFAGYRRGVAAAIETGYRRLVTAPVSAPLATASSEPVIARVKGPASPPEPILTPPRSVTPAREAIPPVKFGTPQTRSPDPAPAGDEEISPPPSIDAKTMPRAEEGPPVPIHGGLQPPTIVPD